MQPPDNTQQHHDANKRAEEDREMAKSGDILTEADLPRLLIHSDILRPLAAKTIRAMAEALEGTLQNCPPGRCCSEECETASKLLARYRGEKP